MLRAKAQVSKCSPLLRYIKTTFSHPEAVNMMSKMHFLLLLIFNVIFHAFMLFLALILSNLVIYQHTQTLHI